MRNVFTSIESELKKKVRSLKMVTRWNNQLAQEGKMGPQLFPAVFYQLTGLRSNTISLGVQHVEGTLRLRICDASRGSVETFRTYESEAAVYLALQGFRNDYIITGLERVSIEPDDSTDAIEVLVVDYRIKYQDRSRLDTKTKMVGFGSAEVALA